MQSFQLSKPVQVGFIGLGDHGDEQLLPSLMTIPNVELTAITSRNPEKLELFANKFKPKFTSLNWEELINPEIIDAVIVSASPELHYQVAKKCLENGIHIFIEKPPTQNLEQLQELIELKQKTNCKTFVGYNFTFSQAFEKLQKPLGQIKFFRSKFMSSRPKNLNYHYGSVLEYALFSMLIHPLATLIDTLGKVQKHDFQLTKFDKTNFQMTNFFQCESGNGLIEWGNYSNRFECDFELIDEFGQTGICRDLWNLEFDLKSKNVENFVENSKESPEKPKNQILNQTFKNKQTTNYHFSPLSGGFGRTGYENELLDFFLSIEQNKSTESEVFESLEIYRVLEEVLEKSEKNWQRNDLKN